MRILLATDGSSHAEGAARFLSHLPHDEPIELTVVTTVFIPDSTAGAGENAWLPEFRDEQYATAREQFDHIATMFSGANVTLHHKIAEGHVGHSITEAAGAIEADLIVLGARGHSAVNRILLGSVSDFVATQATCGVLVVRPPSSGQSADGLRVTIAHDNTGESALAIDQFMRFQWGQSVEGHLLTVVPIIRTFRQDLLPDAVFERARQRDEANHAINTALQRIQTVAPKLHSQVVDAEHVGEAIIDFASEHQSNLIVVGEHQRSALGRLMLGSVSRYVLRHADCSVWIAR